MKRKDILQIVNSTTHIRLTDTEIEVRYNDPDATLHRSSIGSDVFCAVIRAYPEQVELAFVYRYSDPFLEVGVRGHGDNRYQYACAF